MWYIWYLSSYEVFYIIHEPHFFFQSKVDVLGQIRYHLHPKKASRKPMTWEGILLGVFFFEPDLGVGHNYVCMAHGLGGLQDDEPTVMWRREETWGKVLLEALSMTCKEALVKWKGQKPFEDNPAKEPGRGRPCQVLFSMYWEGQLESQKKDEHGSMIGGVIFQNKFF